MKKLVLNIIEKISNKLGKTLTDIETTEILQIDVSDYSLLSSFSLRKVYRMIEKNEIDNSFIDRSSGKIMISIEALPRAAKRCVELWNQSKTQTEFELKCLKDDKEILDELLFLNTTIREYYQHPISDKELVKKIPPQFKDKYLRLGIIPKELAA